MAGAGDAESRRCSDHHGRDDRQRRHPLDHPRSRYRTRGCRVDYHHLLIGVRSPADHIGPARRSVRAEATVPYWTHRLHALLSTRRTGPYRTGTNSGPGASGSGSGHDPPLDPLICERHLPRQGPRNCLRGVGFGHRGYGCYRPTGRGLVDNRLLMALGVLHQHPDRNRGTDRLDPMGAGEPRRCRADGHGSGRNRRHLDRSPRTGLRSHRRRPLRMVDSDQGLLDRSMELASREPLPCCPRPGDRGGGHRAICCR